MADDTVRRLVRMPRELLEALQDHAAELTARGPGRVGVSDLLREGAKKILAEAGKNT